MSATSAGKARLERKLAAIGAVVRRRDGVGVVDGYATARRPCPSPVSERIARRVALATNGTKETEAA